MSFTTEERAQLKSELLALASRDTRLSGVAVTGSAAEGREDRWSDIDLAFGVTEAGLVDAVLADFTQWMYRGGALHHHDVRAGTWIYRVFFLPDALQVDLAFVEKSEFRPLGASFKLVSGDANPARELPAIKPMDLIGLAWLYALHARTCILRGKLWQAEHMIHGAREHTMALACIRHGLSPVHGRGLDMLPDAVKRPFEASLIGSFEIDELWWALAVVIQGLQAEVEHADPALARRTATEIGELSRKPAE